MRMNKLLATLAFSMLFSSGVVVAAEAYSEPYACYGYGAAIKDSGLTSKSLIKLCSGTTDYLKTINCFERTRKDYGLMPDWAINLCKTNSEPF